MGMVHRKSPPVGGTLSLRKILNLAENDGGAGEREGRGGDGDSNEVIGAGGGVLLVIGLGGVLGRADNDDGGGAFLLDGGDGTVLAVTFSVTGLGSPRLFFTVVSPVEAGVMVAVTSWDSLPSR